MSDETPFSTTRAVLNANRGISNVIPHNIIRRDLQSVADNLFNILKGHYGPYSGFAAMDSQDPLKETKFSKDGIEIIRHVELASPQEDWMRKTIAYIGTKIENSVGDGTTSAMMFTCAMLKHMLQTVDTIRPISYNQLRNEIKNVITEIEEGEKAVAATVDGVEQGEFLQRVKDIAFSQAYTSSHGDVELAEAIAEIFASSPKELWKSMMFERNRQEKSERFEVIRSEGQYSFRCDVYSKSMLNQDMGTWYKSDDVKLVIMNDNIRMSDMDSYSAICKMIDEASKEYPLVIVCHKQLDRDTYMDLEAKINKAVAEDKSIAIFYCHPENPNINDFRSLQLLCDVDLIKARKNDLIIREHAKVKYQFETLSLDGLYETPEEFKDSLERYQTLDGKHVQYMEYLQGLKHCIDNLDKLDNTKVSMDDRNMYNRMYSKLRYAKTAVLRIGGNALDNLAMIDVVDDCMRACCKALTNGVVYGNNRTLYHVVEDMLEDNIGLTEVGRWFLETVKLTLEDIAVAAMERLYPNRKFNARLKKWFAQYWFDNVVDILTYKPRLLWYDSEQTGYVNSYEDKKVKPFSENNEAVIVQPANADISMLERFAEVALRYVLTERIIIKGAAYVAEGNKK